MMYVLFQRLLFDNPSVLVLPVTVYQLLYRPFSLSLQSHGDPGQDNLRTEKYYFKGLIRAFTVFLFKVLKLLTVKSTVSNFQ